MESQSKLSGIFFLCTKIFGSSLIIGYPLLFFLLYDDVTNLDNIYYVIIGSILIIALGIFNIKLGFQGIKGKLKLNRKQLNIIGTFAILGTILIPSLLGFYTYDALKPRELFMRTESVTFDTNFNFNSQYGNLSETLEVIIPLNLAMPEDPAAYAWGESYHLRNLVHYYNQTEDPTLFNHIVQRCEMILSNDDWNEDGLPGFGSDKYEDEYTEYVVWDGMIFHPILETARLIKQNSTLDLSYNENYTRFLSKSELMIQKWLVTRWFEGEGEFGAYGYFTSPPNDAKIYNRINSVGRCCYELYKITGNETYKDMVEKMGNFMKMGLEINHYTIEGETHEMFIWPYSEYIPSLKLGDKPGVSDSSHGAIDIDFMDYCYQLGIVFTAEEMEKLANMFFDFVFKGFGKGLGMYADDVSGRLFNANYSLNIRDGYAKMHKFYRDPELALYIVQRVNQEFVDLGYTSAVGITRTLTYLLEVENNNIWK